MSKNNFLGKNKDSKSRVKLYKTRHGWFSSLTRFFKSIFSRNEDIKVSPEDLNKDELDKGNNYEDYAKAISALSALLGGGSWWDCLGKYQFEACTIASKAVRSTTP